MKTDLFFNRLGFNPDLTTRQSRVDSVSIASRCRVLATLLLCLTVGIGQMWGATATWTYQNGSDGLSDKSPISVTYGNGDAGTATQVSGTGDSRYLRLYASRSNGNGGWVTFTAATGYQITAIVVSFKDNRTVAYGKIDNGEWAAVFGGGNVTTITISDLTATSYSIKNGQNTGGDGSNKNITIKSITITYEATASGYAVTYNNGGHGTAPSSTTASNVTLSAITGVTGYTCTGWTANVSVTNTSTSATISAGTLIPNGTSVTLSQATTFTAQWSAKTTTISFDQNGGTGGQTSSKTATYGQAMPTSITCPTREHYDFAGYYDGSGGTGTKYYNADGSSAKNWDKEAATATLYAKWTEHGLTNYRTTCTACEAPDHVTITGTNKYLGGQTISLTATPDGGTGTPSYQWQKKINGTWTNLSNGTVSGVTTSGATSNNLQISSCGYGNSGGYRCIVSTGEGCETKSHTNDNDGYGVHVFSIHGKYTSDANYSDNEIAWTSGTTGKATIHMDAKKTYLFKVWSNNGYYYGHGANANNDFMFQPTTWDCGVDNREMRLFTTVEGDYTFTVNIEHGLDGSPYVNLQVDYPSMTHPNTGYVYVQKFGWTPRLHYWYNNDNILTEWDDDPSLASDQYENICGTDYWCVPVIDYYCNFIAADHNGQTTGDQHTNSPNPGQRLYNDGSWKWGSFTTYTINYAGGGGTGSMSSHTGLCPGSSQALTANTFSRTYHTFNGWSDGNGHTYADQATITNIQSNINLTAQWTPAQYSVTHTLANATAQSGATGANAATYGTDYTATFAATSGYMLPSTITVMAGASNITANCTWTQGTGSLTIPGAYITGNITITITAIQAYTVTFVHHDKGTYSSGSTEWIVPSNDNTITLPTVTSVDCGDYDTFEGWIASNSEYAESDTKPATTIYAGGGSYTVTGNVTLRALYSYEDPDATGYTKITSGVTAGTYLIATDEGSGDVAYTGKVTDKTYGGIVAVTVTDGVISSKPDAAKEITVTLGTGANAGYFAMHDGSQYLKNGGCSNNAMGWQAAAIYEWELDASGNIHNTTCDGDNDRNLEFNSDRFACYKHTQKGTFLFKKGGSYYCTNPSCETPTQVTVTYNANGGGVGSITCTSETLDYGTYPALDDDYTICNTFNREGYTLYKWSTRADGEGGTSYDPGEVVGPGHTHEGFSGENVTLYAQWRKKVSFNIGNATGSVADVVDTDNDGNITLPGSTGITAIPCGYEFWGWRASSVSETTTRPNNMLFAGDTYNCASATLYAVYRLASGDVDPNLFSLSYTYNSTKYYVGYPISSTAGNATQLRGSTSSAEAAAFGVESVDFQTYKALYYMNEGVKEYLYWYTGDGTSIRHTPTKPTDKGWTINDGVGTKQLVPSNATDRNIKFNSDSDDPRFRPYQDNSSYLTVEEASGTSYTYATNPSCVTTATLAFVTSGGTLNYPTAYDASNYVDLTVGTNVYLPTATFPGEWEFVGWMKGSELPSQATSPVGDPNFYTVTLNTTQYTASPAGTTTFYAVYSKTVDDKQWDPTAEGTYKIYAIMSDGTTKKYMPAWGGTQTTLSSTTACPETGEYTITPGTGEHTGQYKITHSTYTLGVVSDTDTKFKNVADAWWNIEASTSGKGTYRITIVGSSNRCLSYSSVVETFGNYTISQVNSPSQPNYRDVEIGECIYTEYTSTPENIPYITITGSPVKITSTNGERVYAPTKVHIEAHNFSTTRTIHFSATNGFATNPASVNTAANGAYSGDVDIYYQPTTDGDGSIVTSVLTASQIGGPAAEQVSQTFSAIKGRNLPQNFVIAVKSGTQWYALPDDCHSSGTPAAVPIEVNDPNAPTAASLVPHNVEWRLSDVVSTRTDYRDKVYFYEPNTVKTADPLTYYNYTLYAGSAPSIQTNAQLTGVTGDNSYRYEWTLTTSDLCAYTISNANVGKNISINTSGNFGTHTNNVVSDALYLLPITAYYEPAKMQVLEWKANSVVVMYTGTQTTATTQVGSNSASSAQTLASQKLTHAVYELTTGQALTSNAGEALKVGFGGGAEMATVTVPIIINSEVTVSESHESQDVVIVSGGKLTAAATKYSFHNIYVYGGGKLAIPSGTSLGTNDIILRAGGISTNGSGGSATYEYVYPQFSLIGTLTNSSGKFRYEYVTDYDHWYQLCLPFNATLSSITYPQEYYGDNVTAANTGSWVIKRYAGEVRATGNYDAWVDIESESATEVTAGHGYIYWGAPKKVTINGDKQRQQWGIQRMTMTIAAGAATTAEADNKTVSGLEAYSGSGQVNDQGWNLVGNPYMVNLSGLSSTSLQTGKLVHEEVGGQWTGRWESNGDGMRYITQPSEHFDTYEAVKVTGATVTLTAGKAFFVQLAGDATALQFEASKRVNMPSLYRQNSVDVETGIVMSNSTYNDKVEFWIKDGKTAEYEVNADYPKTMNGTNFNIYGVHSHGNLSWVAIGPEIAEGSMPIGYQVPGEGDYTLSLLEPAASELESLLVTDHGVEPNVTVDLVEQDYVFHVNQAETNDARFTVSIELKDETPEDPENPGTGVDENKDIERPIKFIYQDKLYILRGGVIYDATGKRVREVNK